MAASLKAQLLADLADLDVLSKDDLKNRRYQRLMSYGYALTALILKRATMLWHFFLPVVWPGYD